MEIDFEKLNKDARELGIEVNENSDNPGMYYRDDDGELVKWDYESEFREVFGEENRRVDDMKYYKVAVFGSREFDDYELLYDKLVIYFQGADLTIGEVEIVEGGARGAVRCQYVELDEINVIHFVFKYLSLQDDGGWKTATYAIGMIEEE